MPRVKWTTFQCSWWLSSRGATTWFMRCIPVTCIIKVGQGLGAAWCWKVTVILLSRSNLKVLTGKVSGNIYPCLEICSTWNSQMKCLETGYVRQGFFCLAETSPQVCNQLSKVSGLYIVFSYMYRFFYMWQVWLFCYMGHTCFRGCRTTKQTMCLGGGGRGGGCPNSHIIFQMVSAPILTYICLIVVLQWLLIEIHSPWHTNNWHSDWLSP